MDIPPARLTRRQLLRQSAGALLAAGLWPGAWQAEDSDQRDDFHFAVLNDTHYLDQKSGPWLEGVVKQLRGQAEKMAFCLVAGDLAQDGRANQLGPFRDIFRGLGVPFHVAIGNHDYQTQTDRQAYEDLFPRQLNYHFEHGNWQFIGLDSSDGVRYQKTAIQAETLQWLDRMLPRLERKKPLVVFTHFPLGPLTPMRPGNAEEVLERFRNHNLQAVFCGHFHGFTERKFGQAVLTTNRCCAISRNNHDGTREKGYFVCQARAGRIQRRFVEVSPA